jgi:uncharacterized protein
MLNYKAPGVYKQELDTGPRPIEGVGTETAAFIGFAPYGPANTPTLITNWTQYVQTFGTPSAPAGESANGRLRPQLTPQPSPHVEGWYLSYAVEGFFRNGGGRCYITRVIAPDAERAPATPTQLPSRAAEHPPALSVSAKQEQDAGLAVEIVATSEEDTAKGLFTLRVLHGGEEAERFEHVSIERRPARNHVAEKVNLESRLIVVEALDVSALAPADRVPLPGVYPLESPPAVTALAVQPQHLVGSAAARSGVYGLEVREDVTMVCCPDLMAAYEQGLLDDVGLREVQTAMINHCEAMGDRIAILDLPPNLTPQQALEWRSRTNYASQGGYAALYYPWIQVAGPDGLLFVPPSGHIAGIYARNDRQRGVHKAPANEIVRGALSLAAEVTLGEQEELNPNGVNCIRSFTGRGILVWGARTIAEASGPWRYINVRRLFNYVEKSLERGTQWVVFEPNDSDLWARVRRDVSAFLTGAWRDGMLLGRSPAEAFYVRCDEELNPRDQLDRGYLVIEIGLAPVRPAEFVVLRFRQWAGGGENGA